MSELDSPGEFYLERSTGKLYFWPPDSLATNEAYVSFGDYTVILGGTASALREAAEESEDGAAESLMEQAARAALRYAHVSRSLLSVIRIFIGLFLACRSEVWLHLHHAMQAETCK